MVAPTWLLMSSPMMVRPASVNFFAHSAIGGDEDRHAIDQGNAGIEAGLGVVLHRLFRPDRQIAEQHVRTGSLQRRGDIGRRQIRRTERFLIGIVRHVGGHAIELRPGLHDDVGYRQRALENAGAVRLGEDRLLQRMADLAAIDVEGGDEFDVGAAIAADVLAHHAVELGIAVGAVILHALDQRAGAIADTGDGNLDLLHERQNSVELHIGARRWNAVNREPNQIDRSWL